MTLDELIMEIRQAMDAMKHDRSLLRVRKEYPDGEMLDVDREEHSVMVTVNGITWDEGTEQEHGESFPDVYEEVAVAELPPCAYCSSPARYDAKTYFGTWAYLCLGHFLLYGVGLGLGRGQHLVIHGEQ